MKILNTSKNIFDLPEKPDHAVCVTTNGMIKKSGEAVMGAGIAKEADTRFKLKYKLADYLQKYGNRPFNMGVYPNSQVGNIMTIVTFPTKNDWRDKSDMKLIRQSAENLVKLCDKFKITTCYLPPVGCGCGGLDWKTQVEPALENILDDRFIIVFRNNAKA